MPDPPTLDEQIAVFLATCRTAALATVADDGSPHAANLQYVHDDRLNLFWVSSPGSAHSRHLAARPAAALAIYAHTDDPPNIHGLQVHGHAAPLAPNTDVHHHTLKLYLKKFTFVANNEKLKAAVTAQTLYKLTPTRLRYIDNRRGFGWKHEIDLADPGVSSSDGLDASD